MSAIIMHAYPSYACCAMVSGCIDVVCSVLCWIEADRISFYFYFSVPEKARFLVFGILFFGRKRYPHFRFFSFFGTKMAVKTKMEHGGWTFISHLQSANADWLHQHAWVGFSPHGHGTVSQLVSCGCHRQQPISTPATLPPTDHQYCEAVSRLMPGFHPSVAVLPLPFRRSVLPFHCTVAVVPFRSYRCRCRENGIDGNVFPLTPFE